MTEAAFDSPELTVEYLMQLGEDARVEIWDGEIFDMSPVGGLHQIVVDNIADLLRVYLKQNEIGTAFSDGLIYLMKNDNRSLKHAFIPDVSFLRNESIPEDWDITLPFPGVPDLAVEVVSPGDGAEEVQSKTRTYLAKGTLQVWVVYPETSEVHQFRKDEKPLVIRVYQGDDVIDAGELFPDIELVTSAFFKLPKWAEKLRKKS